MTSQFITRDFLKQSFNIPLADTNDDTLIDQCVMYANLEVDKILIPFADEVPVEPNTDLFERSKYLALLYAQLRWYRHHGVLPRASATQAEIENVQMTLTDTLVALRTTRTKRLIVSPNPRAKRLLTPAFSDTFIFGEDF